MLAVFEDQITGRINMLYVLYFVMTIGFISWVWTLRVAFQISLLSLVTCFFFQPIAQLIYAYIFGRVELKKPTIIYLVSLIAIYLVTASINRDAAPLLHQVYINVAAKCAVENSDDSVRDLASKMQYVSLGDFKKNYIPQIDFKDNAKFTASKGCFSTRLDTFKTELNNPNSSYHKFLKQKNYNVEAFKDFDKYNVHFSP
jgi:hypothetical protein